MLPRITIVAVLVVLLLSAAFPSAARATFSIVAVDTANGWIGGAGASCIDASYIINSIVESIGCVHTQAYWNADNQDNADSLMALGLTPDSIIGWLVNNDAQGAPTFRQYGVVTRAGPGTSASFTGADNTEWAGHVNGIGYAIQGNILLGPKIVDTIETVFLATEGMPLPDRLMLALEAADIPGADTRCLDCNKPAISAFVKVVLDGDGPYPYCYQVVTYTPCEENPIPALRIKYDNWRARQIVDPDSSYADVANHSVEYGGNDTGYIAIYPVNADGDSIPKGVSVEAVGSLGGTVVGVVDSANGALVLAVESAGVIGPDYFTIQLTTLDSTVQLTDQPYLLYFAPGDLTYDGSTDIDDAVYIIQFIFAGGAPPDPYCSGDVDCSGNVDIDDVVYYITFIFGGGPPLCNGCDL
jgi:uncharacterized Ntn-hydrolase superfamily protein